MKILGPRELIATVRDTDLCVACGACAEICPYHKAHKGKMTMVFDCDREQGQCYDVCPFTETNTTALSRIMFDSSFKEKGMGHYLSISAARAGEAVKKEKPPFQNGGTVSALMMAALDNQMIDTAVLTGKEGVTPVPRQIKKSRDVFSCTGSKYMATPTMALLNQSIMSGGKRHGVVGTSCQMKAAAAMRKNSFGKEEYKDCISLSLGLFCTWSLDTRQFLSFLNTKTDLSRIISMEVPPPPAEVFVIKTQSGDLVIPLEEIRSMIPRGCSFCPDLTAQWADVSVGALEGKPGWNTLIIRSRKGMEWVNTAVDQNYLELADYPAQSLSQLIRAADNKLHQAKKNKSKEAI